MLSVLPFDLGNDNIPRLIYLLVFIVLGASLINNPLQSGGWLWDVGNAFGFVGFAGLLYLFLDVGRGARQKLHQLLSYAVVAAVLAHVVWLWVTDETLWFYMAWDGPHYMLGGWLAVLLLLGMVILALPSSRRFWHMSYQQFQRWHYWLSLAIIGCAYWHMIGSGFYITSSERFVYAALVVFVVIAHRRRWVSQPDIGVAAILIPLGALAFVVLKAVKP